MELDARAKINLTLDILRRREDGYHDMQMVMQSVTLADRLTVTPARGAEGQAASDLRFLPTGNKNLAQVAAAAFREAVGLGGEVDVDIQKRVPVCAGLAGGSADAAAVLRAMNRLSGAGLSPDRLAEIGARAGSDVPFCVLGGTALAEGRGERLTPLPLFRIHPPAVRAGERAQNRPPPGYRRGGGRTGGRRPGRGGPPYVQCV